MDFQLEDKQSFCFFSKTKKDELKLFEGHLKNFVHTI